MIIAVPYRVTACLIISHPRILPFRLKARDLRIPYSSPTKLATEFNLLHSGKPVSAQAGRKWLESNSIPSVDKIVTLANWLGVSPAWLLFGENLGVEEASPEPYSDLRAAVPPLHPIRNPLQTDEGVRLFAPSSYAGVNSLCGQSLQRLARFGSLPCLP